MINLHTFTFEWKHFIRSPYKVIAVALFIIASIYGLHNGAALYHKQNAEIAKIKTKSQEHYQEKIDKYYSKGIMIDEDRPWMEYDTPFWGLWGSLLYEYKEPSSAMVYSIGQSEQYGFYKEVDYWATPYDPDMAEEIVNPERLQFGMLDFSFAILYLLPLVLLVLLYNIKSEEDEMGYLSLVEVQQPNMTSWMLSRIAFYFTLFTVIIIGGSQYGALLTGVIFKDHKALLKIIGYSTIYLLFWSVIYFLILRSSLSNLSNTLKMAGVYLLLSLIIPAAVHQVLSIRHPANLMTDFIDLRDKESAFVNTSLDSVIAMVAALYPEIKETFMYKDSVKDQSVIQRSGMSLFNKQRRPIIEEINKQNAEKNAFIESTFWFNPVSFFQNRLNAICETHFDDYQRYREKLQANADTLHKTMVIDTWKGVQVDQKRYLEYQELFE